MSAPAKMLQGRRVNLHPLDVERDAIEWYWALQEPEMHTWTGNSVPNNVDEVRQLVAGYIENPDLIAWCIRDSQSHGMVGTYWIRVPFTWAGKRISVEALRIAKPFWRTGRTLDARRMVFEYAFTEWAVEEMHANAWQANINSCRSMEHAEFELLETKPRYNPKYEKFFNESHYVLSVQKWRTLYGQSE